MWNEIVNYMSWWLNDDANMIIWSYHANLDLLIVVTLLL